MWVLSVIVGPLSAPVWAGEDTTVKGVVSKPETAEPLSALLRVPWHYGAYLEASYPVDFNFPDNHIWRSKITTPHVNQATLNMALAYLSKDVSESSRWGMELGVQGGDQIDGQVPTDNPRFGQPYSSARAFSHFSRANVSYLAPVGSGLKLTAGLFNSFIGYESFYAKDNFNYTRSYLPDYSPYFMFGVSAQYEVNERVKTAFYVINAYNYLAYRNNLPSYGTQIRWTAAARLTFTQNLYYGPDQTNTDVRYWRFFSDSSLEWKQEPFTVALVYDIGTERAMPEAGGRREFWTGSAIYTHWQLTKMWAIAVRPEVYYDPDGTMTGARQFIKAVTTTLEYELAVASTLARWRLEYRYDDSTGQQGGFFKNGEVAPGVPALVQAQHLLIAAFLWTYDSP